MDSVHLIKAFVSLLDKFLGDIEQAFPGEREIKMTRTSLKMATSVNPRMVIEEFVSYISPYSEQLFNKDHHFFMDISNFDLDKSTLMKGLKIIDLLKDTTDENREIIFKYMQNLYKLGLKIVK